MTNEEKDKINQEQIPVDDTQQTPTPPSVEDTTDDEAFQKMLDEHYNLLGESIKDSYDKQIEATETAYDTQLGGFDSFINKVDQEKAALGAKDEAATRRSNAYRYIAGVGDTISGVANLVGTMYGASNQKPEYTAPGIMQKAEEKRKERKLEMDKLNTRLDELRAQKTALTSSKELKLGELAAGKASALATAELQRLQGMQDIEKAKIAAKSRENVAAINEGQSSGGGTKVTPKYEYFTGPDGKTLELNVTNIRDFDKSSRSLVDAAIAKDIADSTNKYFTAADIAEYQAATEAAKKGKTKALETFYKKHRNNMAVYDALSKASKWTKK